jgi:hypothetical protein
MRLPPFVDLAVIFDKHANDFLRLGCSTGAGSLLQYGCSVLELI